MVRNLSHPRRAASRWPLVGGLAVLIIAAVLVYRHTTALLTPAIAPSPPPSGDVPLAKGKELFDNYCQGCHGADVDNHAINTVPKETLNRITKAEDGGIGGEGVWEPATRGYGPGNGSPQ